MCGIFGVNDHAEASNMVYLGLYSLQHRGQEAAGIVSSDQSQLHRSRRRGLVSEGFSEKSFHFLKGSKAIGHARYSTTGENNRRNIQPFVANIHDQEVSVAHNGNLTNFIQLKSELQDKGSIFQSTMDTEVLLHLLAGQDQGLPIEEQIAHSLERVEGAFSLLYLSKDKMIAVKDPWGFRPLCMGRMEDGTVVFSSESCGFDLIDAEFVRELEPGEIVSCEADGTLRSLFMKRKEKRSQCIFEHVYFSRPDSRIFNENTYEVRKNMGRELAREMESILEGVDLVMAVPDSGLIATLGFAEESKIPFELGMIRNHYVGRTFIEPKQSIRGFGVKVKLNPVKGLLRGKTIVVIDDSIVRGTTSKKIVKMLQEAGVKKIILAISSPPFLSPCHYGINTPSKSELIAASMSIEELRAHLNVDGLHFLSQEGLFRATQTERDQFCDACFTEKYPVPILPQV